MIKGMMAMPDAVNGLSTQQLQRMQMEVEKRKKSKLIMYLLWAFLGATGAHRFYLGDKLYGLGMLVTFGGCGVWALLDIFFIGRRLVTKTTKLENRIAADLSKENS